MSEAANPTGSGVPDSDPFPQVAPATTSNLGVWLFGAALLVGGIGLFSALNANRTQGLEAEATPILPGNGQISSPPPLSVPDRGGDLLAERYRRLPPVPVQVIAREPVPRPATAPSAAVSTTPPRPRPAPPADPGDTTPPPGPSVVFENAFPARPLPPTTTSDADDPERVNARRFANPSRTIPLGTIIPAVLETALDSTRPGAVRALVQRDVHGFDGTQVLIQRGSRLYGEYEADLQSGQKRAAIRWTRLMRPDGVLISLDSPASDPLGRAGVRGKVDSKFFARFGGALLQSVLDVGVGVATREATGGVIVAIPGATSTVSQTIQQNQPQPTLKVKHGTSVSVFVARDLDFSGVGT
ncbi:TrbI/VirB10 family protein [Qipengyuania sp. DSG2-2]|uniref:TrbI/VirB10 family protein n=1 Tax=Qipengyuania sp. DGS2-2 TaxID=3349631 RepID=UPI0036D26686